MVASVSDDATVRIWGPAPQYRGSGGRSGAGTSGNSSSTTANGLYTSHTSYFFMLLFMPSSQWYLKNITLTNTNILMMGILINPKEVKEVIVVSKLKDLVA